MEKSQLQEISRLVRYWLLTMTHRAGSGHPTSSMSAVELMVDLFFGGSLRYADGPQNPNNDRVVFSKGHASPLLYALWAAAGFVAEEELEQYREFGSRLEGHPTSRFELAEAATGSLGQGLSIGAGMALNAKRLDRLPYRVYVLLGDSEMAEGSQWEAIQLAAQYELDNLVGILDVNRLGQRGETMYGHDLDAYQRRIDAFGWRTILIEDGHDHEQVLAAYEAAAHVDGRPVMLIARTIKGKGVSFLEDNKGWHGKALDDDQLDTALRELGDVDRSLRGEIARPAKGRRETRRSRQPEPLSYARGASVATRDAYGKALCRLANQFPDLVVLDAEVCNSTGTQVFRDEYEDRFFEMYIAEQNMVGTALGLALRGKLPFVSTFAAFFSRAFDQIRMAVHSEPNLKFAGSHAGAAIGQDGPSQMGLEDLALFRTLPGSVVLYPCDAVSTERLVEVMAAQRGIHYLRTTRGATPVIYDADDEFVAGGCKVLRESDEDVATVVGCGVTTHEALQAYDTLAGDGVYIRVIDLYSIKPLDEDTLRQAARETPLVITVEDHYPEGGVGEAVSRALSDLPTPVYSLAVRHRPRSGKPEELLRDHGISARAIVDLVQDVTWRAVAGYSASKTQR